MVVRPRDATVLVVLVVPPGQMLLVLREAPVEREPLQVPQEMLTAVEMAAPLKGIKVRAVAAVDMVPLVLVANTDRVEEIQVQVASEAVVLVEQEVVEEPVSVGQAVAAVAAAIQEEAVDLLLQVVPSAVAAVAAAEVILPFQLQQILPIP